MKPKPKVNKLDDTVSEAVTIDISVTTRKQVNQIEKMFAKHSISDANYDSDYDEFYDNCVAIISDNNNNAREVETVNVNICVGNTETKALVDSGSICTIINKILANAVVSDC